MVTKRVTVEMIRDGVVPCDCGRGHCITTDAAMLLDMVKDTETCPECHALVVTADACKRLKARNEP